MRNTTKTISERLSEIPVISYFWRYWWVLALIVASVALVLSPTAFSVIDLFVYIPFAFALAFGLPLIWRYVFHSKTTDHDVRTGFYWKEYQKLMPRDRVMLVTFQWVAYVIASALIVCGFMIFLSGLPVAR